MADGLASDGDVNLYASRLSRPTNLHFHNGWLDVANLGHTTITRARIGRAGKPLANQL
jgi:hypothetical protein